MTPEVSPFSGSVRQIEDLQILHAATQALHRAANVDEVCRVAIDTLRRVLGATGVSILTCDDRGRLRVRAEHGLSPNHRPAVESWTPWSLPGTAAIPVTIPDLAAEPALGARREVFLGEGVKALALVPLEQHGAVVGTLLLCYDSPRAFDEREIRLAHAIAGHVASSLDRARTEQALRQSEARYRAIFELSLDGILVVDDRGTYIDANESFCRMLNASRQQVAGAAFTDFVPAPDAGSAERAIADLRRTGQFSAEFPLQSRDGRVVDLEWRSRANVVPGLHVCVVRDVSRRKQIREALHESNERLRAIFNQAKAGIVQVDLEGRFVMANERFCRILDRPADEVGRLRFRDVTHPEDLASSEALFRRLLTSGETFSIEKRYLRPDGSSVWASTNVSLARSDTGTPLYCIAVVIDISVRKQAEEAARHQMRINRIITDNAASCLIMFDPRGRPTFMNPAAEATTGYSLDEIRDRSFHESLHHTRPNGQAFPRAQCPIGAAAKTRVFLRAHEDVFIRKDGTFFPVACSLAPLDQDGSPAGAVLEFRDITEQKRAAEERDRLLERERTVRAAAEAASRLKDEFLATLSHELRTPLNAVLGWARLLAAGDVEPAKRNLALAAIERNAQSQVHLVNDILDLSNIITGRLRLKLDAVDATSIVRSALESVQPAADARRVRIEFHGPPDPIVLSADADRLRQIIWNLLSNAVKFTPDGGTITVDVRPEAGHLDLRVTDTGHGIDPAFLPFVFDRFRQEDSTPTRGAGGLGLGLAIVRYLAEAHGGTVHAHSDGPGRGATFLVRLPVRPAVDARQEPATGTVEEQGAALLAGVRVLVVDDDADSRELVGAILEQSGGVVRLAASSEEALAVFTEWQPDVLVADIGLPHEDGYALLRRIRARASTPALALTAYADARTRQQSTPVMMRTS